jgi:AcrR family transcriptional regulator
MNDTGKLDRRIQRTRRLLREALMRLITREGDGAKRYDEITIRDITDEANVARTTFYLHFKDKDELLFQTMRDIYDTLVEHSEMDSTPDMFFSEREADSDGADFHHAAEYADFYRVMFGEDGSAAFNARVRDYMAAILQDELFDKLLSPGQERVPAGMMSYAIAGAQIAVIKWWLDNDMPYSPQKMSYMLEMLLKRGLFWGMNISPESFENPPDTTTKGE